MRLKMITGPALKRISGLTPIMPFVELYLRKSKYYEADHFVLDDLIDISYFPQLSSDLYFKMFGVNGYIRIVLTSRC
uniref:Uncharacterized protein n=1 Tax=Tetranychus urticae TaxID=32264 RepID=T1KCY2_TETUR